MLSRKLQPIIKRHLPSLKAYLPAQSSTTAGIRAASSRPHAAAFSSTTLPRTMISDKQPAAQGTTTTTTTPVFKTSGGREARGYAKEQRLLAHVVATARKNDPAHVLQVIDEFALAGNWLMNVGDEKGAIVESLIATHRPSVMVELGAYVGYSAVCFARHIPAGGKYISFDVNPTTTQVARGIVEHAGLSDRVTFILGSFDTHYTALADAGVDHIDMLFVDHWKDLYKRDVDLVVRKNLLRDGSVVVADNTINPGTPEYLAWIRAHPKFTSRTILSHLEYSDEVDALEVSVYKA
ncbi:S-adenosyl-L-methionine-dependent methyltransferase [Entophlyctis helioformis]|nr:S-adenosyl-L-methionine-dependent methyltransferase [Entophlyctis helioformis]